VADPFAFYCPACIDRERLADRTRHVRDDRAQARIDRWN